MAILGGEESIPTRGAGLLTNGRFWRTCYISAIYLDGLCRAVLVVGLRYRAFDVKTATSTHKLLYWRMMALETPYHSD